LLTTLSAATLSAATLLAATTTTLLATLLFALTLLAFTFLFLAILLLAALLSGSTRFAWLVWILLCFHITFRCCITNFSLIFSRFAIKARRSRIALEGSLGLKNLTKVSLPSSWLL
jgi:hypothetical protein